MLCDPNTPHPEDAGLPPFSNGNALHLPLGSPLGRDGCLVKLECFRFLPPLPPPEEEEGDEELGDSQGQTRGQGDEPLPSQDEVLGSLELLKFRESGIASEYESNTDESDDRDSWGDSSGLRLFNVLDKEAPPDCLGDEIAV